MSEEDAIRDLAAELNKPALEYSPATLRKGVVVAVTATDVTITLSGSDVEIPGVSFMDHYSPVVGDIVQVLQQANAICILGQLMTTGGVTAAGGWTAPAMAAGWTGAVVGRGTAQFRLVIDNGAPKVQWMGSVLRSSGTGTTVVTGIPASSRPTDTRTFLAARAPAGGSNDVTLEFRADGTVVIVGDTTTPATTTATNQQTTAVNTNTTAVNQSATPTNQNATATIQNTTATNNGFVGASNGSGLIYTELTGFWTDITNSHNHYNQPHNHSILSHSHQIDHTHTQNAHTHTENAHTHTQNAHGHTQDAHTHTQNAHGHTQDAHSHAVTLTAGASTWVSLDGIEYFL